eukprot:m.447872 g.447872  ORF g.447872 m.447872 type:complete len:84 (+) comp56883_c1_seq1:301-552(+)
MAGHAPRALRVVRSIEIEAEPSAPLCVLCFDPITDDTIPLTNCACSVCSDCLLTYLGKCIEDCHVDPIECPACPELVEHDIIV